jgi:hypothetical protein
VSDPRRLSTRKALGVIAIATLLGAFLRALGLPDDFWLDEVWSWQLASGLSGAGGVFTQIHHSNNHHLLTLWMFALGPDAPVWAYRLPSFLAGVATIPLAAALAWGRSRLAALAAAIATMSCFALIHFASEARGYALAVALALAAQLLLQRALLTRRMAAALGFGLCVSLGLLAHLGFVFYWAGAFVQGLWEQRADAPRARLRTALALHALPAAVLAALYAVDLRFMVVGAGNPTDLLGLATRIFAFGFGAPLTPWAALPTAALVAVGFAAALRQRRRAGDGRWLGDLVTVVLAPLAVFALFQPDVIAVRYFLIGIALCLIALSELVPAEGFGGRWDGTLYALAFTLFVVGNTVHTAHFLENGRGGYRDAVLAIASHADPSHPARVSSDHDFRTGTVLRFHARRAPEAAGRIEYVPRERALREGVDWWILHAAQRPERPRQRIRDAAGHRYRLFAEFDHAAISGFYWALYRAERAEGSSRSSTTTPKPSAPKGSAPKR